MEASRASVVAGSGPARAGASRRPRLSLGRSARARWRRHSAAVAVALGLSAANPAFAHAPPLGAQVLSLSAPEGHDEVVVTNRGLVFRDPDTGTGRLLCNEALRINTAELPNVALLGDGGLIVANSSGLRLSRDRGCTWSDVGQMQSTNTPALAADPSDPNRLFVATYDEAAPGLRESRDAGASWTLSYETSAGDYVGSLMIAATDPARIYASVATYGLDGPPQHSLLRTRDGGDTWERLPLPLNEKDYMARLAAVSSVDPDTFIVYTVANNPGLDGSRLLISRDGGETFDVALERPEIRGAGYGADGTLWVAARDGLYGADSDGSAFSQISLATELGCVGERAGSLLVCGHYAGVSSAESGVGVSRDGGRTFERWLDFAQVDAPVACSPESLTTSLCARPWLDWQTELLGGAGTSPYGARAPAATGAAGTPAMAAPVPPPADLDDAAGLEEVASEGPSASCALAAPGLSLASGWAGLALAALLAAGELRRTGSSRRARISTVRGRVGASPGKAPEAARRATGIPRVPCSSAGVYPCPFGFAVSVPLGRAPRLVPVSADGGSALAPIASALALAGRSGGLDASGVRVPTVELRIAFERVSDVQRAAQRIRALAPLLLSIAMDAAPGQDAASGFRLALEVRAASAHSLSVHLYVTDTHLAHERALSRCAERLRPVLAALVGATPRLETHFILRRRVIVRCRVDLAELVRGLPERDAREPLRCAGAILQVLARLDGARSQPALAVAQNGLVLANVARVARALGSDARRIRAEGHCHASRFGVAEPLARLTPDKRWLHGELELPIGVHWNEGRRDPDVELARSLVHGDSLESVGALAATIGLGAHLAAFRGAVAQMLRAEPERRPALRTLPDGSPPRGERTGSLPSERAASAGSRRFGEVSGVRSALDARSGSLARKAPKAPKARRRERG